MKTRRSVCARRRRPGGWGLLVCLAVVACGGGPERNGAGPGAFARAGGLCPGGGTAPGPEDTFAGREGTYRLTLVVHSAATRADGDASATATLTLEPMPPDLRDVVVAGGEPVSGVTSPVYGWTDLDPGALGAAAPGDVSSRDPARPGVLVLEDRSQGGEVAPGVVLRFGDHANDRTRTTFDQAFLALRVEWLESEGAFGGRWSSGGRGVPVGVRGTFCAAPAAS